VDWLAQSGAAICQVLPLTPTDTHGSPYASWSAFAGDPHLIALEPLVNAGLLGQKEVDALHLPDEHVDRALVEHQKMPLVVQAAEALLADSQTPAHAQWRAFEERSAAWLDDVCLFDVIHNLEQQKPWWQWPAPLRDGQKAALDAVRAEHAHALNVRSVLQGFFDEQWHELRAHVEASGISLWGDLPIYVQGDSADVWRERPLFELKEDGEPALVAGVPPDAFAEAGQFWGQPVYRWSECAERGWRWWKARIKRALSLTPRVRIDHFRAFAAYWAIPAGAEDARGGHWEAGPGRAFFEAVMGDVGKGAFIAEDLGIIDDAVNALRDDLGLPGMAVLQFAYGSDEANPHLPANHRENQVVYTGTHDNATTLEWHENLPDWERDRVARAVGHIGQEGPVWAMIRQALASRCESAVIPMQDLLELGAQSRMNRPGTVQGNWQWRMASNALKKPLAQRFKSALIQSGRADQHGHEKRAHAEEATPT
jgi:4-alpha-glucanotransferase